MGTLAETGNTKTLDRRTDGNCPRLFSVPSSCDKFSVNSSSQTAYDIARFWGHRHVSNLLGRTDDGCQRVLPGSDLNQQETYFSRETLDRLSGKRTDRKWLETKQSDPSTVYLLFCNLSPMVSSSQEDGGSEVPGNTWSRRCAA